MNRVNSGGVHEALAELERIHSAAMRDNGTHTTQTPQGCSVWRRMKNLVAKSRFAPKTRLGAYLIGHWVGCVTTSLIWALILRLALRTG